MATSKKTPSGAVIYLSQSWRYFGSVFAVSRESSLVKTGMAQLEVVKGGWYEIANKVTNADFVKYEQDARQSCCSMGLFSTIVIIALSLMLIHPLMLTDLKAWQFFPIKDNSLVLKFLH